MDPLTLAIGAAVAYGFWKKAQDAKQLPSTGGLPPVPGVMPARVPATPTTPAPTLPTTLLPVPSTPSKPVVPKPKNPVPNWSGNAAGYNTARFPSFVAVRQHGYQLGYKTAQNIVGAGNLTKAPGEAWVRRFQADYNKENQAPGKLAVDGVPGPQTLNAFEWIHGVGPGTPQGLARALWWATRHTGNP